MSLSDRWNLRRRMPGRQSPLYRHRRIFRVEDHAAGSGAVAEQDDTDVAPDNQAAEPDVDLADVTAVRLIQAGSAEKAG